MTSAGLLSISCWLHSRQMVKGRDCVLMSKEDTSCCICCSGSSLLNRTALSRPLLTTRLFIMPVSRVNKILPSTRARLTICESSSPLKNTLSNPSIRSHRASLPTFSSTINRNSLTSLIPRLDFYFHTLTAETYFY